MGRVDILIDNAGNAEFGSFFRVIRRRRSWKRYRLSFSARYEDGEREAATYMISQRDGRIVRISSASPDERRAPGYLPGSTSMRLLLNLAKGICSELASQRMSESTPSRPGATQTERAVTYVKQTSKKARGSTSLTKCQA